MVSFVKVIPFPLLNIYDTAAAGAGLRFGQNTYFTGNVIDVIFIKFPFGFY